MGCFNTVIVRCPSCDTNLEFQTKYGSCNFVITDLDDAEPLDAAGLIGESETCACGTVVTICGKVASWIKTRKWDAQ